MSATCPTCGAYQYTTIRLSNKTEMLPDPVPLRRERDAVLADNKRLREALGLAADALNRSVAFGTDDDKRAKSRSKRDEAQNAIWSILHAEAREALGEGK